jgi:hypothetical protein
MIYEWKKCVISFFMNKVHFFRKLFCKEYFHREYAPSGKCKERYAVRIGFLDCCYEECPKRKGEQCIAWIPLQEL